jgi:hypothetical protein
VTIGRGRPSSTPSRRAMATCRWEIDVGGHAVVAESDDIAIALKRLEPCLHLDTFEQMIRESFNERRAQGR